MSRSENFNKIIDSIKSKVSGDDASAIKSELSQVSALFEDTIASLSGFGSENKEKRLEITKLEKDNRQLRADLDNVQSEFDTFKESQDSTELESLREYKANVLAQSKNTFMKQFDTITEHDKFSKVKKFFTLPDADEEGKYDLSSLADEDIEKNINQLNQLNDIDYFDTQTPEAQEEVKNKAFGKSQPKPADFQTQLDSVETMEDLEKLNNNIT